MPTLSTQKLNSGERMLCSRSINATQKIEMMCMASRVSRGSVNCD